MDIKNINIDDPEIQKNIKRNLRIYRECILGIDRTEMAESLGVSRQHIYNLECNGSARVTRVMLYAILYCYNDIEVEKFIMDQGGIINNLYKR